MIAFSNILDEIMLLDKEDRFMLTDILKKRQIEDFRQEFLLDAQASLENYNSGKFKSLSAEDAIKELHDFVDNSDDE